MELPGFRSIPVAADAMGSSGEDSEGVRPPCASPLKLHGASSLRSYHGPMILRRGTALSRRAALAAGVCILSLSSQSARAASSSSIRKVIERQVEAWNTGDLKTFVQTYAEDAVFVGKPILHGRKALLSRYESRYPNRAAMGRLSLRISELNQLDANVATVIGEWHLTRPRAAGGDVGGIYSLVLLNRNGGWKIVLDHTE